MSRLRPLSYLLLSSLVLGVVGVPRVAVAQDAAAMSDARAKFQKGVELEHAKNWGGALKLFREVGQVKMSTQVRYHIATCEENLGQLVTALGGYELALGQAESEGAPEEFMAELQKAVESLRARIPKVVIERGEGAEAATIELDQVALGTTQLGVEIPLDPGPHTVTASAVGYEKFQRTVTVKEGEAQPVSIVMTKLPEDKPASAEPMAGATIREKEADNGYGIWPIVAGGAGAAILVTGVILLPISQGQASEAKTICGGTDCSRLTDPAEFDRAQSLASGAKGLETVGWVGVGLGAALVGTGVTLFFLDPARKNQESPPPLAFRPVAPRADLVGWSVVGAF